MHLVFNPREVFQSMSCVKLVSAKVEVELQAVVVLVPLAMGRLPPHPIKHFLYYLASLRALLACGAMASNAPRVMSASGCVGKKNAHIMLCCNANWVVGGSDDLEPS